MSKLFKFLFILLGIGLLLIIIGFIGSNGDFTNLKNVFTDDEEYTFASTTETKPVTSVIVDTENRHFKFYRSDTEELKFEYYESERYTYTYSYDNETETAKLICNYKSKWNFFVWFRYTSSTYSLINVYLPKSFTGSLNFKTSNGGMELADFTLNNVTFTSSNGSFNLKNLNLNNLELHTSNGRFELSDITAAAKMTGNTSNGKLILTNLTAQEIHFSSSNGDVNAINMNAGTVYFHTSNGDIDGNNLTSNDIEMETSNGRIELDINGSYNDYRISSHTSNGKTHVGDFILDDGTVNDNASKSVIANSSNGNIYLNFLND
jgi:DUF4097 and DUF4098 domain-containing protein YvlB